MIRKLYSLIFLISVILFFLYRLRNKTGMKKQDMQVPSKEVKNPVVIGNETSVY